LRAPPPPGARYNQNAAPRDGYEVAGAPAAALGQEGTAQPAGGGVREQ